jgi:hypothetical protein
VVFSVGATKQLQELTLIKNDDKFHYLFESFLYFWTAKDQDLEGIEENLVDDVTRCIWLASAKRHQPSFFCL